MVRVKILMSIAGHAMPNYSLEDFAFQPGQEVEINDGLALRWSEGGIAELLEPIPPDQRETASLEAPEKSSAARRRSKKAGIAMAILTMGTALTDDVEAGLQLTEIVDTAATNPIIARDAAMLTLVVKAAESHVKLETGRNFEETVFVDQAYDIAPNTTDLLLSDRPVVSIESIEEVTARYEDGTVTTRVIPAGQYVVNNATGILSKLSGSFLAGKQVLLVSWTAGYAPADITTSANNEIRVLKQLCLSIVQNWHTKRKHGIGDYTTMSAPGESASFNFDFTPDEIRMINQLRIGA